MNASSSPATFSEREGHTGARLLAQDNLQWEWERERVWGQVRPCSGFLSEGSPRWPLRGGEDAAPPVRPPPRSMMAPTPWSLKFLRSTTLLPDTTAPGRPRSWGSGPSTSAPPCSTSTRSLWVFVNHCIRSFLADQNPPILFDFFYACMDFLLDFVAAILCYVLPFFLDDSWHVLCSSAAEHRGREDAVPVRPGRAALPRRFRRHRHRVLRPLPPRRRRRRRPPDQPSAALHRRVSEPRHRWFRRSVSFQAPRRSQGLQRYTNSTTKQSWMLNPSVVFRSSSSPTPAPKRTSSRCW